MLDLPSDLFRASADVLPMSLLSSDEAEMIRDVAYTRWIGHDVYVESFLDRTSQSVFGKDVPCRCCSLVIFFVVCCIV